MDEDEQRVLFDSIVRELTALAAEIDDVPASTANLGKRSSREELAEVQAAVEEAGQKCALTATPSSSSKAKWSSSSVVRDARGLRASAVRERDIAERRLVSLHELRSDLLAKIEQLESKRTSDWEQLALAKASLYSREEVLTEECEELQRRGKLVQDRLLSITEKVEERGDLGIVLNRRRRALQKIEARSAAQSERSREILALEAQTQEHVDEAAERCGELERKRVHHELELIESADRLEGEKDAQEAWYRAEEADLEAKLQELQSEYEEQWNTAELDVRQRLEESTRKAEEVSTALRESIAQLDEERENEVSNRRRQIERQQEALAEGRSRVMAEMEEKIIERRHEMQERVDEERYRYSKVRSYQLRKLDDLAREVQETKNNIAKTRDNYRSHQTHQPELPALRQDFDVSTLLPARYSPYSDRSSPPLKIMMQ